MAAVHTFLLVVLSLFLSTQVWGHAVLISPVPFNKNPVTNPNPCGVQTLPTPTAAAIWTAGSPQTLVWRLVASDGGRGVYGTIDPEGGTSFTVNAWEGKIAHGAETGQNYDISFTVPASLTCPKGLCTLRVVSDSGNWISCTYINVTTCNGPCPTPPPSPPVCKIAGNLGFCSDLSQKSIQVPADASLTTLDQNSRIAYNTYIVNPNVFANNDTNCQRRFKEFLCATNLPPCPGSGKVLSDGAACHAMCQEAMSACKLTETHKNLYDCSTLPKCNNEESSCSLLSSGLAAAAAISVAAATLV